jgi:hypothetical protein
LNPTIGLAMNDIKAFNLRQLKILLKKIDNFQNQQMNVSSLIYDIEALLDCVKTLPKEWLAQMWNQWEFLEITYASVLDKKQPKFTQEQIDKFDTALNKIKGLITTYIKENFNKEGLEQYRDWKVE